MIHGDSLFGILVPQSSFTLSQFNLAIMKALNDITKHFNKTLARSFMVIFLSTLNYGFDNQGFSTSEAMPAFKYQFGEYNSEKKAYALPTYWLSLFNSLNYLGFAVGVMVGSLISSRWGRRMCIFVMSCWALVAAAIVISSTSRDQMLAGRVLFCERSTSLNLQTFETNGILRDIRRNGTFCYAHFYVGNHASTCSWYYCRILSVQSSGSFL